MSAILLMRREASVASLARGVECFLALRRFALGFLAVDHRVVPRELNGHRDSAMGREVPFFMGGGVVRVEARSWLPGLNTSGERWRLAVQK